MQCEACGFAQLLPAAAIGCIPSSPTNPEYMFSLSLCTLYDALRHSGKCSVDSFCDALDCCRQGFSWYYGDHTAVAHGPRSLDPRAFSAAYRHFVAVYQGLSDPGIKDFEPGNAKLSMLQTSLH